jgi:hypothetical protein
MLKFDYHYCFNKAKNPIQYILDRIKTHDIDWEGRLFDYILPESFLIRFKDQIDWEDEEIYWYHNFPESLLIEFQDKIVWEAVCASQELSEDFMERFQDKMDWGIIIYSQTLSEDFIDRFKDKAGWKDYDIINQILSKEFVERHRLLNYRDKVEVFLHGCPTGKAQIYLDEEPKKMYLGCDIFEEEEAIMAMKRSYDNPVHPKYKKDYLNKVKDLFKRARELSNAKNEL